MAAKALNVLIVDDEMPLRQELRLFPWEECGAVLIGEAGNGEEALQQIESQAPDVVVTDITMPIMDGITLIRELRRRHPAVQIILLTCHSDFRYVQEALRLGALEYLLKVSMDEVEMKQALEKVRAAIAKDRHSRDSEKSERRLQQAALFGKLLHGREPDEAEWRQLGLDGTGRRVLARIVLHAPNPAYVAAKQRLQHALNDIEGTVGSGISWLSVTEKEYFVLLPADEAGDAQAETMRGILQALTACLEEGLREAEHAAAAHAIVSGPFAGGKELALALARTNEWKEALFYDGADAGGVFAGSPLPLADMTDKHAKEMQEMLRKSGRSPESLKDCLQNGFFEWCAERRFRPQQLKQRMLGWRVDWLKAQDAAGLGGAGIERLLEAGTLREMTAALQGEIEAIESGSRRPRFEIRAATEWIQENMKQPISLPILAEHVGLSPQYVSRLFREETGYSVGEYITRLRMERAVELLRGTNKKVYEIAEEVGIPSYRYFTVTFRNWTGVSPTDFKRQH
ncbi:response regulator [Paenibacillus arenilitoris]|uniref:Response regulator n=1 Tax=Paenibacillus arenilitoris TaxID=2772299 RepID=A0A927CK53_9BACL|nr:response regulator [Paenibacillus arenilitoris]MBD2867371.1 response regulator [Paenibacillus arenilitoris]